MRRPCRAFSRPCCSFSGYPASARVDVASAAGVDLKVIHRLCRGDYWGVKLETLARVADALGAAPAELVPELARRPRTGLLYSAGVFKLKR